MRRFILANVQTANNTGFGLHQISRSVRVAILMVGFLCLVTLLHPPLLLADPEDEEIGSLLVNQSFESGNLSPWAGYGTGNLVVQSCCAKKGSRSAKLSSTNNYFEIYQTVNVAAGHRYKLAVWVYTNGTTATLSWYSNVTGDTDFDSSNSQTYERLVCEFFIPNGTVDFNVHLWIQPTGAGNATVDGWMLKEFCQGPFCYAEWDKFGTWYGVWAIIETADPVIREGNNNLPQLT